jgi:hypothetical protein
MGKLPDPKLPDQAAGAPRKPLTEHREEPFAGNLRAELSQEEIHTLVDEAARERAHKRGLASGYTDEDWVEAEAQIMTELGLWD